MFHLHVCLGTACLPGANGSRKRALDWTGLELELQAVGNHMGVLGIRLGSSAPNCWGTYSAPPDQFLETKIVVLHWGKNRTKENHWGQSQAMNHPPVTHSQPAGFSPKHVFLGNDFVFLHPPDVCVFPTQFFPFVNPNSDLPSNSEL